ncbi:uncharacterized protein LOC110248834 [Exaiptasia diaphana]|uniref:Uncharacterized protein n=1 Tax=Exaiptasia diaphana TaxID=2652724 RepID=A0A913XVR1_EXADI|nr:uncharacterized protein LOC110248834 [Exaiptasia diaphana]
MSEDSDALGFSEVETLHRWMSSFCSGSSVSIPDLMYYPPWIIAACLNVRLKTSKNAVNFYHRLQNMMEVESFKKISVCLFACILSQCSEMVLHENEISENSQVWTTSMELLKSCPEVLFCFMEDDKSHIYSHDLQQLRTLLLPNKYSKLLPIVFFSLLTKCKRDIVEKVKQFPHFKQITITMNQKFTQLRKTCLENDAYKSCEKPFQLEFAKEVFQFLRHHTGS